MKLEELLEGVSYRILQKPAGTQEAKESGAADKDIEEKDIVGKDIAEKDIPTIVFDNRKVTEGCLFHNCLLHLMRLELKIYTKLVGYR